MKKLEWKRNPTKTKESLLGVCIYTIYNRDRRMEKPNLAAGRNSSLLVLKAYAKTNHGEKYVQRVHNTPNVRLRIIIELFQKSFQLSSFF